jgi:hypothetical protein
MRLLDWMNKGRQASAGSAEEPVTAARFKQEGDPFKEGDRIVVYEPSRHGVNSSKYAPGVVSSVYHKGLLVNYEGLGLSPRNAPVEDVRHATEFDCAKYKQEFAAIEAKVARKNRAVSYER